MNSEDMRQELDRAWLAGLMEGEGCFSVGGTLQNGAKNVRAMLCMNDSDIVQRAHAVIGFGATRQDKKGQWWWTASGFQAAALALWLYPNLGQRRRGRIKELVEQWMEPGRDGHHYRDATHCKRGHLFDDANTYRTDKGRECRACQRLWREAKAESDPEWVERRRAQQRTAWPKRKAQRAAKRAA